MSDEPEVEILDLNILMSIDALELTRSDIDQIIAYQRKHRAQREAGIKVKKPRAESPKINFKELLASIPKPEPAPKKPGSTIRRRI